MSNRVFDMITQIKYHISLISFRIFKFPLLLLLLQLLFSLFLPLLCFDDIMIIASVCNTWHHNFFVIFFRSKFEMSIFFGAKDTFMQWTFKSFITNYAVNALWSLRTWTHRVQRRIYAKMEKESEWKQERERWQERIQS